MGNFEDLSETMTEKLPDRLSLGTSSFAAHLKEGQIYVDKTDTYVNWLQGEVNFS